MKRLALFSALSLFIFGGCTKDIPTSEVIYSITEGSAAAPTYEIIYTNDKGGGQMVTSYNTASYSSGKIELEQGQFISMKVSCSDPVYTLNCSIFINGNLWKNASFSSGGSVTLSGEIPAE